MKSLKELITEKLRIGKSIKINDPDIYWFRGLNPGKSDDSIGIKLPFTIHYEHLKKSGDITICRVEENDKTFTMYDEKNKAWLKMTQYNIRSLFSRPGISEATTVLFDHDLPPGNMTNITYNDDESKIVHNKDMNESAVEKIYANMILLNPEEDSVLILRRANYMRKFPGMYGFPGGSVDAKDKDVKTAAIRELKEETGIELSWNEEHKCKKYDTITNNDGSISEYYITTLESNVDIKLSKEHAGYEWFNEDSKKNHKWMPDVFQIIQKIL